MHTTYMHTYGYLNPKLNPKLNPTGGDLGDERRRCNGAEITEVNRDKGQIGL